MYARQMYEQIVDGCILRHVQWVTCTGNKLLIEEAEHAVHGWKLLQADRHAHCSVEIQLLESVEEGGPQVLQKILWNLTL